MPIHRPAQDGRNFILSRLCAMLTAYSCGQLWSVLVYDGRLSSFGISGKPSNVDVRQKLLFRQCLQLSPEFDRIVFYFIENYDTFGRP